MRHYQTGIPGTQVVGRYRGFSAGTSAQPAADYTVDYSFDNQGRLQKVIDPQSTYQYTYASQSHLVAAITSPAHTTTYTYEANRDLKVQVQNDSAATYRYGYDAIRRRTHRLHSGSLFAQNSFDTFQYNTRSEVIASDRYLGDEPSDTSTPTLNEAFAYQFDAIGNRLQATAAGITESYTSNELNQYQTIGAQTRTYDADGNLTSDGQRHYDWTAENRLKSIKPIVPYPEAQRIDYQYDYLGRRIQKTVSQWNGDQYALISDQKFLYDEWNLVATYDATANNTRTTTQTWGLDLSGSLQGAGGVGGLLSTQEHQGAHAGLYHYACDANGNVTEIFDHSGAIAAHYQYDPFGNTIASIGSYADTNKFRFSTKYWDEESELYYYGYRYYDPATGRWSNRDPIQEQGGLNLYAMVQNNPLDYWDYLGMSNCGKSWWDKTKEVVSTVVDVVPVAGTVKSVVETVTGKDPITGEPVNRAVAAAGIGASLIPGGKAALKTGVKAASALSDGAKGAAKNVIQGPPNAKVRTSNRPGNQKAVELRNADGSIKDISPSRVKEFVPNNHPKAPPGARNPVKFDDALPGTKGLKRAPTQSELNILRNATGE